MISPLVAHLSEKAYAQAKDLNTYVFKADRRLSRAQIKQRLETEYEVKIVKLRVLTIKGKPSRSIRIKQRSSRSLGQRKTIKKAYVVLKEGDVIPVFTDHSESGQASK